MTRGRVNGHCCLSNCRRKGMSRPSLLTVWMQQSRSRSGPVSRHPGRPCPKQKVCVLDRCSRISHSPRLGPSWQGHIFNGDPVGGNKGAGPGCLPPPVWAGSHSSGTDVVSRARACHQASARNCRGTNEGILTAGWANDSARKRPSLCATISRMTSGMVIRSASSGGAGYRPK